MYSNNSKLLFILCVAGIVPWQVYRQWFHAALLQAHVEQEAGVEGPRVDRPGVLLQPCVDQVGLSLVYTYLFKVA